ncbi:MULTISPECIES: RES family NAD+ phosphorylase [Acinetobacter]|uniref:RES family NAD+ phosphorylase n=2 Tax=Acinetobacter TaxID=469 RepID=UPI001F4AF248|nr:MULTISPECIES: RES family NAD+ phosphorylase [Acinetobacter]MCH7303907.1 RES family NAD+ phosphorylase [Acinetobacter higginsii]
MRKVRRMSVCCANCFNDNQLKHFILNECHGGALSRCSFCRSEGVQLIDTGLLSEHFETLTKAFDVVESDGLSLVDALQQHFSIFNERISDKNTLLNQIFKDNQQLLSNQYKYSYTDLCTYGWASFKDEIVKLNRFFPQTHIYKEIFSKGDGSRVFFELTETLLSTYSQGDALFRARLSETMLTASEMEKPPANLASAGRANPVGIPYLYLSNNIDTCIAEVRPSKGAKICIATFRLNNQIKLLDLTNPRERATFLFFNDTELKEALDYTALLEKFSYELSLPVLPTRTNLDYIPTQFICEFFKAVCGYAGVIFKSSFGFGDNIVLFNDEDITCERIMQYEISEVINKHSSIS